MHTDEKYQVCVESLADYVKQSGFSEVVIGLSGGIDSSLTALMCVDAFGAAAVHGVLLPGPYSSDHSVEDAWDLAHRLGISAQCISICEPFEAFENVLRRACGEELRGSAAENTQARCRMVILMALSNAHGWLLINTGNKSEACMGYSTLYGDTAGAYAPLGGLYKTDVFAVSRFCNQRAKNSGSTPPIPEHVLTKPPSAELSVNQEDEKSLGIDYTTLDKLLIGFVEKGKSKDELIKEGFDANDVVRITDAVASFAYKRALKPPFPTAPFYAD